ncbi:AraC family transcriptional regulator [Micromonospora sonneratiae]
MQVEVDSSDPTEAELLRHQLRTGGGRAPVPDGLLPAPGCRFRFGASVAGIERLEAALRGEAFSPHRHDRYAVGVTLTGVQTFRYRGQQRHCLPGEWHVLHPDELHDGAAGTEDGFGYRIIYLDPALVQDALGGGPLPFVADPVIRAAAMSPALKGFLAHIDEPPDEIEVVDVTTAIADTLRRHAGPVRSGRLALDMDAIRRVRGMLTEQPTVRHRAADLEVVAGLDRWSIARQFRAAFGTSPTRYRTMRQLDMARRLIRAGHPLAVVAAMVGFADQAHLTRLFKRTYGLPPGAWAASVRAATPPAFLRPGE